MNDNTIINKGFLSNLNSFIKNNLKKIIFLLSLCFVLFLFLQIYSLFITNKIQKNSVSFFSLENNDDINSLTEIITNLSNEKNFYGLLSKLELIKLNFANKNNEQAISLYFEIINNNDLNEIYKSAIASRASYQLIDINFRDLSSDYSKTINDYISFIDDKLDSYKGIKLELIYLTKILEVEKNNIKYTNLTEAIEIYNNIINSNIASSIKERVNKIHEFYSHK